MSLDWNTIIPSLIVAAPSTAAAIAAWRAASNTRQMYKLQKEKNDEEKQMQKIETSAKQAVQEKFEEMMRLFARREGQ